MYKNIMKTLYNSGVYLIITLGVLVLLTSLLWLFNIPVSCFHLPLSCVISGVIFYFIFEKNIKSLILTFFISIVVLIVSILASGHVYDQSDDGNSYHKETVAALTTGWNPIYDDYKDFAEAHDLTDKHQLWAEHYPKTTWILASDIYKITGDIETGKFYNLLLIYIAFTIFSYILHLLLNKKILNIIVGLLVAINPITMSQVFSYYVDGFLGLLLYLIILFMYLFIKKDDDWKIKSILTSLIILIVNVKFTGLAYSGLFCLGYFIYYIIFKIKNKEYDNLKKNTIFFVIVAIVSIGLVGSNSYIKNTVTNGNPLYPLMGKDKVDIITYLQPKSFADKSPIEKNFYSIFSWSENIGAYNGGEPRLKTPFEYSYNEIKNIGYDTRIGGYGVLFSGIFIISLIVIIYMIGYDIYTKNKNAWFYVIPIIITILLMFFLSDSWWARYAPQLYLFIIIAMILLASKDKIFYKLALLCFAVIVFYNSALCFSSFCYNDLKSSGYSRMELNKVRGEKIDVYIAYERSTGLLANLRDKDIDYKIVYGKSDDMIPLYGNFMFYSKG